MKKHFLTTLLIMSISISLWADEQEKHEFTVGGILGLSTLKLNTAFKPMGGVSVGYNYFFSDVTGISTGLGWSQYRWYLSMDEFSDRYMTHDGEDPFELRSSFTEYSENHTASFLVIPLAIRFQYPMFSDENLTYFSIGAKAGIPLKSTYNVSGTTFTTSGYYPAYDILLESPHNHGLGTFTTGKQTTGHSLKTMWALSAEAGMKWDIAAQFSLYAGICIDYSLNSINKEKGKQFLVYNQYDPTNWSFNSMLHSKYTQDGKTNNFVNRVNPISAGIVIRIAFKLPE